MVEPSVVIRTCEWEGDYDEVFVDGDKVGCRVDLNIEDLLTSLGISYEVEEGESSVGRD